jgi:hypothetical protein
MTAKRTDREICQEAIAEARRILGEYIDPGRPHDAEATVQQLLEVLDSNELKHAMARFCTRLNFELVTTEYYGPPKDAPYTKTEIGEGPEPPRR